MGHVRSRRETHSTFPGFSSACERFGLKPTYLVNYEMAVSPAFVEFGRDVQARGMGEIGMHLHAWNSPPIATLTGDDNRHKPFLIEYPADALRAKVDFMTKLLQDLFATPITSHRAGRWAMNEHYARTLGVRLPDGLLGHPVRGLARALGNRSPQAAATIGTFRRSPISSIPKIAVPAIPLCWKCP